MQKRVLMLAVLVIAIPAWAQIYEWRDAQGNLNFSDRPPPGVEARPIRSAKAPAAPAAPEPAAASEATPASAAPKSVAEQNLEFQKRREQQAEARQKAEQEQQAAENRRIACDQTRNNLAALESGQRIRRANAQGESEFLDDAARATEIERSRALLRANCP
ncbi:MAG TPA: DUF4124 domain-containing protein [Rhodocyclaceae bacterium]|nr:DUF4124 domain-containing protein [Rhodocyclaceae bacterium]